jgi:hypothetical protein
MAEIKTQNASELLPVCSNEPIRRPGMKIGPFETTWSWETAPAV